MDREALGTELKLGYLMKELGKPFSGWDHIEDDINNNGRNQRREEDVLEDFLTTISQRRETVVVLEHYGFGGPAGKAKLETIYQDLWRCGAGPPYRMVAIYDPNLLALLLKARADGIDGLAFSGIVFDYIDKKTLPRSIWHKSLSNRQTH